MIRISNCSLLPKRLRVLDALLLFLAPLVMLAMLEGYSRTAFFDVFPWLAANPLLALINYALLLGLCLLLSALRSDRLRVSLTLAICLLCALLGIANHYKILYRLEPLMFTDVTQLADAKATMQNLAFDIDVFRIAGVCAVFAVMIASSCLLLKKKQEKHALLLPILGAAILVLLPAQCTFELANGSIRTDMVDHARNEGTLYAAIAMENHRHALMRMDYTEQGVRAAYVQMEKDAPKTAAQEKSPNVIVVLSESFWDEAFLGKYLQLTDTLMPFYRELMKDCRKGGLYVPKLGGGTSETEFEVLTGLRSQYAINPYSMGLPPMNSLASVLREKGYESTAIHWYSGVYYNRYKNLAKEGFNAFYTTDTTTTPFEKKGMFVCDAEHYKAIMEQLRASANKDFVFCLTMQNHGGYAYDDFRKTYGADVPFANQLSAEGEKIVSNYCYLLRQSDAALRDFIAELKGFDEPTMLVFFGDHMPPFGAGIYEELKIPLQGDEGHYTPYFIWSNQESLTGEVDMCAYQLGAHALTLAGLNDDPFLSYVETLREKGVKQDDRYDLLSYDALFGKQYGYHEGKLSPENADFQIGGKMTLEGFDTAVVGEAVYVLPRLAIKNQAFKLSVDNQLRDTFYVKQSDMPFALQCVMTNSRGTRYNHSNSIAFASTEELVRKSGKLAYTKLPLHNSGYELVRDKWYQGHYVFKSMDAFEVGKNTAVTIGGELYGWQPTYGISKGEQYGVDNAGYVYLSVPKNKLSGATSAALCQYLVENQAFLYVFKN